MILQALIAIFLVQAATPSVIEMSVAGPAGPLKGTLLDPGGDAPGVVIIPGSGPTDRDGNSPMGITAAPYRLLAEALAQRGVASVRIDKRGMFGSAAAIADANAVTVAAYADDANRWAAALNARIGNRCAWLVGHSEGALVALQAAQRPQGLCGIVLVAGAGRKLGTVIREQLQANPANASILAPALAALDTLEQGKTVDVATLPVPLRPMFNAGVQGYLIDLLAHDPAALAQRVTLPMLIVQGERDLQVPAQDARLLMGAQPKARLALVPGVNHVLKSAPEDRAGNFATYADASLPVAPAVVDAIAGFVTARR